MYYTIIAVSPYMPIYKITEVRRILQISTDRAAIFGAGMREIYIRMGIASKNGMRPVEMEKSA